MPLWCLSRGRAISKEHMYFTLFGIHIVHFTVWKEGSFPHAGIIQRDGTPMEEEVAGRCQGCFSLADVMYFSKKGCEAVAEDEVTQRFSSEELLSWNLLSRTNANLHHASWKLAAVWVTGILFRYCLLLPFR